MKDVSKHAELVERFLQYLREKAVYETCFNRAFCIKCATDFNNSMNSKVGKIEIGKFHGYQNWVGIMVKGEEFTVIFWADFNVYADCDEIEIDFNRNEFKVF